MTRITSKWKTQGLWLDPQSINGIPIIFLTRLAFLIHTEVALPVRVVVLQEEGLGFLGG
jgi:hypothetical protein